MFHVKVYKKNAQKTIEELKNLNLINVDYKIINDSEYVYIPLKSNTSSYDTVDIEGIASSRPKLEKVSFSYDIMGSIAIIKGKTIEEARSLSTYLKTRKNIKTIYYDSGISGEFRTRQLKLIYGEPVTRTVYRENGIRLNVDVSKAYFSPRLASERLRIAKEVLPGEYIIDMFAGIGPFSLLIAKNKECKIIAMDINPDAITIFNENIKLNKLKGTVAAFCGDSAKLIKSYNNADRVIMNLPHDAWKYTDLAYSVLKTGGVINYYEICDLPTLEYRMECFKNAGLEIIYKRIVHGFSKYQNMYSIELKKI
ncbi:class I SAM-dependent methyltransferase family protein [Ferroplasma sp.]|uniref:class I SAM-dependent methyltransferase n=1 Tax=Ferroplasma sp. TaxID=2591003 RepID=UPI00307CEAC2